MFVGHMCWSCVMACVLVVRGGLVCVGIVWELWVVFTRVAYLWWLCVLVMCVGYA